MLELLYKRRSIRKYLEKNVEKEKVDKIIEAALLSPSSKARRPWEFIIVDDKKTIEKLAASKQHGSQFLTTAPLAIVVLAKVMNTDVWVEDASIASTIIQLEAETLDLGSCWIQIRNRMHTENEASEKYIQTLLDIPEEIKVESIIGIGYPDEEKSAYNKENLLFDKVHYNKY